MHHLVRSEIPHSLQLIYVRQSGCPKNVEVCKATNCSLQRGGSVNILDDTALQTVSLGKFIVMSCIIKLK
jgi:hypothetical protein